MPISVPQETFTRLKGMLKSMHDERLPWFNYWRELADYVLPRRYIWLEQQEQETGRTATLTNKKILDGTATVAARTLAAGMMNGITSPARPWFRLRAPNLENDSGPVREWLDEVAKRMLQVMAETNFYNAMAVLYLDLGTFATAAMLIYEDDEDVFRCYPLALGEYYLLQNNRKMVDRLARKFRWRVEQIVREFGEENCSQRIREAWKRGGDSWNQKFTICHLIEPNDKTPGLNVAAVHRYREVYWEDGQPDGLLRVRGYREWPALTPRWETLGNDSYGTGPAMDALGDIKQLQHMTLRRGQAMDKAVSPPLVADIQLQHRPVSLLPNGITYVAGANSVGIKPVYTVNMPFAEIDQSIIEIQNRIRIFFHNDLFRMISQLDTVRSATEIDARREEKLVLLGPVLERFENEALDPAIYRIFSIMLRNGLLPPPPVDLAQETIEIQYVSVLSDAQSAVGAIPIERFVAFLGNLAAARPEVLEVPDWAETVYEYASRLGVPAKTLNPRSETMQRIDGLKQQQAAAGAAELAPPLAGAAQTLSETDVGGGANALQQMLGGV